MRTRPSRRLRTAAVAAAAAALSLPASALAMLPPDGFYDAGGPGARWYALFWNGAFVSEAHVKGCATEIPITQSQQPNGTYRATVAGTAKTGPCVVALGLNVSADFRTALGSALRTAPAARSFAVVEVAGGKPATEIAGTGYISDVTVAGASAGDGSGLLEVEIVPTSGTLKKAAAAATRTVGAAGVDAIDLAQTTLALDGQALGAGATIRPLAFKRHDSSASASATTYPAGLELTAPVVGVPPASAAAGTIDSWFSAALTGPASPKQLTAVFKSAGARTFTVKLDALPARWDPYPTAGGRELELGANATPADVS
jgi:hypothetical protein